MFYLLAMVRHRSDVELVSAFKEGDRSAYEEIVRRYQDRVYSLALRWMRDEQIAREVAQDAFLALYRALPEFRGDAKLSTWIYRVVVNHCKNRRLYRRRRHTDHHEPLEGTRRANDEDAPGRQFAHEGPGTDAGVNRTEAEDLVREALDQLDDEHRAIIVMRDVEDLDYEEIADILGLARGTVKSRLHRARSQLARVLSRRIDKRDVI